MASVAPAPASPSSSPRLPSPPPFPEVQLPPISPSPRTLSDAEAQDVGQEQGEDTGAARRIRPGTKAADMASGPPLVPLSELDSPFQLQEHLLALFLSSTRSADSSSTMPITRDSATKLATPPEGVDRALWLYELCRLLVQRANSLIVGFFSDSPPCSATNCPEMRASEWQYLCAVHDPPKSCCAIDYCCHTLDWAANTLTSQKHFPSRLSLGGDAPGSSQASVRALTNVFRRVYRMFAHAWFQHRDVFWKVEGEEGLYVFYKTVCDVYGLIPEESYTVPKEAEGGDFEDEDEGKGGHKGAGGQAEEHEAGDDGPLSHTPDAPTQSIVSTGATTRRHKHTPSTGSFVTTIAEGDEDGDDKREGFLANTPSLVSTVRRDPSSSPPKSPKKSIPLVKLPDVEDQSEEPAAETEPEQAVTQKLGDMSIEDAEKPEETEKDEDPGEPVSIPGGHEKAQTESEKTAEAAPTAAEEGAEESVEHGAEEGAEHEAKEAEVKEGDDSAKST